MNIRHEIDHFSAPDGVKLFWKADEVEAPRAALMLVHGFGEHCGRYDGVVARLNDQGYSVYRLDLRGHGQSDGARGHIFSFSDYLRDVATFRGRVVDRIGETPQILMGHSNGGLVAFHSAVSQPGDLIGLVMSSPFFGFEIKVPKIKAFAGRIMSKYVPAFALPTDLDPATVSHDPEVVADYAADPLNHAVASGRWLTETTEAHRRAMVLAPELKLPVLLQAAGDDKIVSTDSAKAVFDRFGSEDRTWQRYEGFFHEIWFELERERPLAELERWLRERTTRVAS